MELLINIDVDDLERAIGFYTDGLGLHVGRRFGGDGVELLGAHSPIYLLVKPTGSPASNATAATRDYARHWTPVHIDFVVHDVEAAVARAEAAGAVVEAPVELRPWGRIAVLADPFGHGFCLLEFRGRGYDAIAS